jgi:hypothetical protein
VPGVSLAVVLLVVVMLTVVVVIEMSETTE